MFLVPVEIGHLQCVKGRREGCERRDAHPREVDGPELHLFDDRLFLAELFAVVDLDPDPAAGALLHQAGEFHIAPGCGVVCYVGFAETEHHLGRRRSRKSRCRNRDQYKNRQKPFHSISPFLFRNKRIYYFSLVISKTQ